jgi:hypothetical protein
MTAHCCGPKALEYCAVTEAVKELSPEDKRNVAVWDRPSWPQEGRLRL